jgi:hypothetical protein
MSAQLDLARSFDRRRARKDDAMSCSVGNKRHRRPPQFKRNCSLLIRAKYMSRPSALSTDHDRCSVLSAKKLLHAVVHAHGEVLLRSGNQALQKLVTTRNRKGLTQESRSAAPSAQRWQQLVKALRRAMNLDESLTLLVAHALVKALPEAFDEVLAACTTVKILMKIQDKMRHTVDAAEWIAGAQLRDPVASHTSGVYGFF